MKEKLTGFYRSLQQYSDRPWYPALIGFLAGLDNLIIIIPTDGILISSCILQPRKWLRFAFAICLGSTIGAMILVGLIEEQGLYFVEAYYPHILNSSAWQTADTFFDKYGLLAVFLIAASPLMQHPVLILAGLADTNLGTLAAVVFVGRFAKYLVFSAIAAKSPRYLSKLWGIDRKEMEELKVDALLED